MTIYLSERQAELLDVLLSSDLACCEDETLAKEIEEIRRKLRRPQRIREEVKNG